MKSLSRNRNSEHMVIHRAHKVELIVNESQELYLKKVVGCARFAFNWALNEWKQEYEAYKKDPGLPKPSHDGSDQVRRADGDYSIGAGVREFLEESRTLQVSKIQEKVRL